ncbi:hypothetical protein ERJ75_000993400 [Trypanosoma vivax]|nr:hypothetical protein TRVL_00502 [Trypanosoma vivax]KAH8612028.1 hypothetical protein ERJ75_000993400 [Trypanosoma vivax]
MDTLQYVCKECNANAMHLEVPLISVKANAFSTDMPALIASHRKLLCMNMKQPNCLRVLTKQGRYADTKVTAPFLRHLVSSEGHLDHCAFFAAGGNSVARLKPVSRASGEVTIALREVDLAEEIYGIAVGNGNAVYALGKTKVFEVDMEASTSRTAIELMPRTVVRGPVIAYHHVAQLILTPAKNNCLDLISSNTERSVLPKVWEPHANMDPSAAFFLQRREFSNEHQGNLFIVTAANGNRELRLWCYSGSTHTFSLKQDIFISSDTEGADGNGVDEDSFIISCTPSEEYITLCSRQRPIAVVLELHRNSLKVDRITSWKLNGPALGSVATVGKIAESASSTSIEYQLMLTIRTASGFYEELLDVEKLAGASNTAAMKKDLVATWFPQCNSGNSEAAAVGLPAALTSVSSSVLGDKTTNAVPQGVASNVVRQQASSFCQTLYSIDKRIVDLQKRASGTMRLFQEARERQEAQTAGREFAVRNKGRLELQKQLAGASPDGFTPSQRLLLEEIRSVVEKVQEVVSEGVLGTVKLRLSQHLKDAVMKGAKEADQLDIVSGAPTVRSTDSMRVFSNGLDASVRTLTRALKDHCNMMKAAVDACTDASASCVTRAKEFREEIVREKQLLAMELEKTRDVINQVGVSVVPIDPDTLVKRAVELAEKDNWAAAFTVVLEASDITVLLAFLENKVCVDNMSIIVKPQTIALPTFLSLCLQLSYELNGPRGCIPLRIQLLHAFFVEWDDALKEIKKKALQGDNQNKQMFELTKRELLNVIEQVALVDDHAVDRRSRNNIRLLKKLMVALLAD